MSDYHDKSYKIVKLQVKHLENTIYNIKTNINIISS